MSEKADSSDLVASHYLPYVYVFWRQAEPTPHEVAAVHRGDPNLKELTASEVANRLKDEDWWRIGPLDSADEAERIASELSKSGLRIEMKWQ